jgi:hypothetical protein
MGVYGALAFGQSRHTPSLFWLKWRDGQFTPSKLPEIGQRIRLLPVSQPQGSFSWRAVLKLIEETPQPWERITSR